jgi:cysteine sulfinate desulfinase/cysteine desulfurase-like protein
MGVAPELAHGAVRCSLGITNTAIEVDALLQAIRTTVERMQLMKAVAA